MKTQSFKLFAAALVLGLAAVFGTAASANAQDKMTFEVPFAFYVGKDKLAAGKYEIARVSEAGYWLRNVEAGTSSLVRFNLQTPGLDRAESEKVVFNRYGDTYFLRNLYDRAGDIGRGLTESKLEKELRRGGRENQEQLADKKKKPEQVSVNVTR